jgi:hypothetical protein
VIRILKNTRCPFCGGRVCSLDVPADSLAHTEPVCVVYAELPRELYLRMFFKGRTPVKAAVTLAIAGEES